MADRSQQAQRVFDALEQKIAEMGFELVDVAFVKEGPSRFLRIFIDKKGGISLEDCTEVSHMADPVIDEELKITSHDYLEVSSPGIDRPLKTSADFVRYLGETVEIKLYQAIDGTKVFEGSLLPCSENTISIETDEGKPLSFARDSVARVKRVIRFD